MIIYFFPLLHSSSVLCYHSTQCSLQSMVVSKTLKKRKKRKLLEKRKATIVSFQKESLHNHLRMNSVGEENRTFMQYVAPLILNDLKQFSEELRIYICTGYCILGHKMACNNITRHVFYSKYRFEITTRQLCDRHSAME